jgi:hypothetical protein
MRDQTKMQKRVYVTKESTSVPNEEKNKQTNKYLTREFEVMSGKQCRIKVLREV